LKLKVLRNTDGQLTECSLARISPLFDLRENLTTTLGRTGIIKAFDLSSIFSLSPKRKDWKIPLSHFPVGIRKAVLSAHFSSKLFFWEFARKEETSKKNMTRIIQEPLTGITLSDLGSL
jgi:hypothetical protein